MNKTAQLKHYKAILNKGPSQSLYTERKDDYDSLINLFSNHPDYPCKLRDLKDIIIVHNKRDFRYYEFNLVRSDGTIEDISYIACISKPNKNKNLFEALRYCVQPQINSFRQKTEMKCNFCSKTDDIHIDHIITFKSLTDDFLKDKITPKTFDYNSFHGAMFRAQDKTFSNEWYSYHVENARLRPLCKSCNLRRSKN
jgi:hypothetical protein